MCVTAVSKAFTSFFTKEETTLDQITIIDSTLKMLGSSNSKDITAVHYRCLGKLQ